MMNVQDLDENQYHNYFVQMDIDVLGEMGLLELQSSLLEKKLFFKLKF